MSDLVIAGKTYTFPRYYYKNFSYGIDHGIGDIYDAHNCCFLSALGLIERIIYRYDSPPLYQDPPRFALLNYGRQLSNDYYLYLSEIKNLLNEKN